VLTASPQKYPGRAFALSIQRAMATMLWLRRSTIPFCCGEYGAVSWRCTPRLAQYSPNYTEVNSPPTICAKHLEASA